jgi:dGTP triphosphohydrolase
MYQERTENEKLVRVVCDYLGGMTDHYIEDLRKKLLAGKKAEAPALPPK